MCMRIRVQGGLIFYMHLSEPLGQSGLSPNTRKTHGGRFSFCFFVGRVDGGRSRGLTDLVTWGLFVCLLI